MTNEHLKVEQGTDANPNIGAVYQQLCDSYRAVDAFRGQLLGFLPLVSGGVFVLLSSSSPNTSALLALGLFGVFITLGLYIFEIYGTRRCTHYILLGRYLETQMGVEGQFRNRPQGLQSLSANQNGDNSAAPFRSLVNEPMAAGIIYPAVGAAWLYVALQGIAWPAALLAALVVFGCGVFLAYRFNRWLVQEDGPAKWDELRAEEMVIARD